MPKGQFEYHSVPGSVVNRDAEEEVTYRFEKLGRGKTATERWQRYEKRSTDFDSYAVAEVIERLSKLSEGLEDAFVGNEIEQDYSDHWINSQVRGWVAASEEEVAAVKRHVMAEWERAQDVAAQLRERAEAEIKSLALRYPELVAQYAPHAEA